MKWSGSSAAIAALAAIPSLLAAQVAVHPGSGPMVRPNLLRPSQVIDPLAALQSRISRLEKHVAAVEATLARATPALTFACADHVTSTNSLGVSEDCGPYTCAPIDGRCRTQAVSSDQCSGGTQWVQGNSCVAPDASASQPR